MKSLWYTLKPEFLSVEEYRSHLTAGGMAKIFFISGTAPVNFINRRKIEGRPVRANINSNGHRLFKVSDVIAAAKASAKKITPPIAGFEERENAENRIADLRAIEQQLETSIDELKSKLSSLELAQAADCKLGFALLSQEALAKSASRSIPKSGVYFLLQDDEVVYVGQGTSVLTRIGNHIADPEKEFNGYCFIECEPESMNLLESVYIHLFAPKHNGRIGRNMDRIRAPLSMSAINEAFGITVDKVA
ncbi:hypothetical protein CA267_002020 [Alteromonas pelagimontana]|uniref:GIY-YIG nuclease family protein n=1 Tax=Alteromonas pelagimontana TaxID=1858656 RepID=A0A6M4MAG7_9ALTE|nr:GIY-YIG nuclease family protein [Alteromonas pelagimontana]QJR79660.1 hypothetical protein CA267_002020 [Alteromonas pelagimontana]